MTAPVVPSWNDAAKKVIDFALDIAEMNERLIDGFVDNEGFAPLQEKEVYILFHNALFASFLANCGENALEQITPQLKQIEAVLRMTRLQS